MFDIGVYATSEDNFLSITQRSGKKTFSGWTLLNCLAAGSTPADLKNQSELLMKSGKTKKTFMGTLLYGRRWLFAAGSPWVYEIVDCIAACRGR